MYQSHEKMCVHVVTEQLIAYNKLKTGYYMQQFTSLQYE